MRGNRKRKIFGRKFLQSAERPDEGPSEVEIKEEIIDPEIETILEYASLLHSEDAPTFPLNDDPSTVSSSTDTQFINVTSRNVLDTAESLESAEIYSPDSTQHLGINDPSAVNEEESSEFPSCDAVVQNKQPLFKCESPRLEVKTSSYKTKVDLSAFEIKGECTFEIVGEETILAKSDIKPSSEPIGVIGYGPMAKAIICYLLRTKHIVFAYNRTKGKLMELSAYLTILSSPAALFEKCDIILSCVSHKKALRDIMKGPNGILKALEPNPNKAYVEMSSVELKIISKYAKKIAGKGGRYLAAPIGRTRPAAYLGCALVTASGDLNTFTRCRSCFAAFSSNVVYLSSDILKAPICNIVNTVIEGVSIIGLTDILLAMERIGLPRSYLLDMLEFQPRTLPILRVMAVNMLENRDDVFLPVKHVSKHIAMALELEESYSFSNGYLRTALSLCNEITCHYPEAKNHDISCLYKLRSTFSA